MLVDYAGHFASLKNARGEWAEPALGILEGDMAVWSEDNRDALLEDEAGLTALVEYLVAQAGRSDLPPPDASLLDTGREAVVDGVLPGSGEVESCLDCHALVDAATGEELAGENYAPTLTGYGGTEWVRRMIARPGEHYGDPNAMPAFASQLSADQIDLLARWLTGDYRE